ncbi:MAG: enoyl-CoA hydratase/isomerase family protein [Rhizobiales bacterium]|nr:enoyl-CoA hydratase/isomerase family protein [Hyphomicrobiales bacterium]
MIDVKINDGIAVLTLMHGKANALDLEFCEALAARFQELRGSAAKAVVITGQGRMFSAGVDLKRLSEGGADYIRKFLPVLHKLYDTVFFHPKPVVAAINGHAIAGGAVLAACADRRIMARESGRIGVTELLVGVPFPALAFEIVRFAVPPYFFSETILSGETFAADVAAHRGWVNEAVAPALMMERAMAAAQSLAALSPPAFAQTKMQIRQAVSERMAASGQATDKKVTDIWTAPATLDFIRDYVARTLKK